MFIVLINTDDTEERVNINQIVNYHLAMGATEIVLTTENTLRVKETPYDVATLIEKALTK